MGCVGFGAGCISMDTKSLTSNRLAVETTNAVDSEPCVTSREWIERLRSLLRLVFDRDRFISLRPGVVVLAESCVSPRFEYRGVFEMDISVGGSVRGPEQAEPDGRAEKNSSQPGDRVSRVRIQLCPDPFDPLG